MVMRLGDLEAPKTIQTADDAFFAKHPCFTIYELAIITKMIEKKWVKVQQFRKTCYMYKTIAIALLF